MKKLLILMLVGFAFLVTGCQNSVDSEAKKEVATPDKNGDDNGNGGAPESPVNIGDDGTVTIGARSLVYIKETTETVDSVSYTVKNYADVYVEDPYFYTYYKLYYLNNKLRRLHIYNHSFGAERDYKYTEFVEHQCFNNYTLSQYLKKYYSYYENGKIESYLYVYYGDEEEKEEKEGIKGHEYKYDIGGKIISEKYINYTTGESDETVTEYNSDGKIISRKYYDNSELSSESKYEYFENGNKKLEKYYRNNVLINEYEYFESGERKYYKRYENNILTSETEYYENGNRKFEKYYRNNGYYYTVSKYDENGKRLYEKQYENDVLKRETEYYANGEHKLEKEYENNILTSEIEYYENGKTKYRKNYNKQYHSSSESKYNENGQRLYEKHYSNDVLEEETYYYSNDIRKANIRYERDSGKLCEFTIYYSSGFWHYHWESNHEEFYTFDDEICYDDYNSYDAGILTTLTEANAPSKLEELLSQE